MIGNKMAKIIKQIISFLEPAILEISIIVIALLLLIITQKNDLIFWYTISLPGILLIVLILLIIAVVIIKIIKKFR